MKTGSRVLSIISKLHRRQTSIFNNSLKTHDMPYSQHLYLLIINSNPGLSQNELTRYLSNNKATTAKTLKKLEEEDLVIKIVDEDDKRGNKLFLKEKGKKIVVELQDKVDNHSDDFFMDFDEKEIELLEKKLLKLLETADKLYREDV